MSTKPQKLGSNESSHFCVSLLFFAPIKLGGKKQRTELLGLDFKKPQRKKNRFKPFLLMAVLVMMVFFVVIISNTYSE